MTDHVHICTYGHKIIVHSLWQKNQYFALYKLDMLLTFEYTFYVPWYFLFWQQFLRFNLQFFFFFYTWCIDSKSLCDILVNAEINCPVDRVEVHKQ
jgi:hypothetical protein